MQYERSAKALEGSGGAYTQCASTVGHGCMTAHLARSRRRSPHLNELIDSVFLPDGQSSPLFHKPRQILDLMLELLDSFLGAPLLFVCRIDHLPRLLYLSLQRGNRILVLLR